MPGCPLCIWPLLHRRVFSAAIHVFSVSNNVPTILVRARSLQDRREDRPFDFVNGQRELRRGLSSSVRVNCASASILGWCFGCEVRSGGYWQWQDCILRRGSQNPYLLTPKLNLSKCHRSYVVVTLNRVAAASGQPHAMHLCGWIWETFRHCPRQTATFHHIIG